MADCYVRVSDRGEALTWEYLSQIKLEGLVERTQ